MKTTKDSYDFVRKKNFIHHTQTIHSKVSNSKVFTLYVRPIIERRANKNLFFFRRIRLVKQSKQKQTWRVLEWTKNSEFIYVDDEWSDRWPFGEIFFLVKISSFLLKCSCWFIDDDCFYDECTYSATFMKTFGLFTCCWSKLMVVITWTFLTKFLSILLWHPNETFIFYFVRNRLLSLQYS